MPRGPIIIYSPVKRKPFTPRRVAPAVPSEPQVDPHLNLAPTSSPSTPTRPPKISGGACLESSQVNSEQLLAAKAERVDLGPRKKGSEAHTAEEPYEPVKPDQQKHEEAHEALADDVAEHPKHDKRNPLVLDEIDIGSLNFQAMIQRDHYRKNIDKIAQRVREHQWSGDLQLCKIGNLCQGEPDEPEKWPLYSPEIPPHITNARWYDPTGLEGFPAFVILDDQCCAMAHELGFSNKQKHYTWPGNFKLDNAGMYHHRHRGYPARDRDGFILQTYMFKSDGIDLFYRYSGDINLHPIPNGTQFRALWPVVEGQRSEKVVYIDRNCKKAIHFDDQSQVEGQPQVGHVVTIRKRKSSADPEEDGSPKKLAKADTPRPRMEVIQVRDSIPEVSSGYTKRLHTTKNEEKDKAQTGSPMNALVAVSKRLMEEGKRALLVAENTAKIVEDITIIMLDSTLSAEEKTAKATAAVLENSTATVPHAQPVIRDIDDQVMRSTIFFEDYLPHSLDTMPNMKSMITRSNANFMTDLGPLRKIHGDDIQQDLELPQMSVNDQIAKFDEYYRKDQSKKDPNYPAKSDLKWKSDAPKGRREAYQKKTQKLVPLKMNTGSGRQNTEAATDSENNSDYDDFLFG